MSGTQTSSRSGDGGGANALAPASNGGCVPEVEWKFEEARHVIGLKVKGFKKEHLRVQADTTLKELIVTGERPQDCGRPVRFRKTFRLEDDLYCVDKIRAKLLDCCKLDIILPLKKPRPPSPPPAGGEPKPTTDVNGGPSAGAVVCGGVGLTKQWSCWVLAGVVITTGAIVLGAFLIYRYFMM